MVICSTSGTSVVTLNKDGNPVAPSHSNCGHCADCIVVSSALIATIKNVAFQSAESDLIIISPITSSRRADSIRVLPRGPPASKVV